MTHEHLGHRRDRIRVRFWRRVAWDVSERRLAKASFGQRLKGRHQGGDGYDRYPCRAGRRFADCLGQEFIR
jgi:hypothetical protein